MTAHQHHTHPESNEPFCCCGYGYPDCAQTGESVAGLPTWAEVWAARDPLPVPDPVTVQNMLAARRPYLPDVP